MMRLVAFGGKGGKNVLAFYPGGRLLGQIDVQRPRERPLELTTERRRGRAIQANVISIPAGDRRFPGVKAVLHRMKRLHPAVLWEQGVQRAVHVEEGPAGWCAEAHALAERMDSGIGS